MRRYLLAIAGVLAAVGVADAANGVSLVQAARSGDAKAVHALLQQRDVDVNMAEADGATALHYAADLGDFAIVDDLVTAGANVNAANRYGVTPLKLACISGNPRVVERLLKAGADPNAPERGGETLLMTAARTGQTDLIKMLIAHGANVNAAETTRGQTALMWAAAEGNVAAMKVLIEAGADIDARSNESDFKRISRSANMRARDAASSIQFTPLFFAVRSGYKDAVKTLLDAGVPPNEKLPDGVNAVIVAIINAHWELAAYLLDRGADPNSAEGGWTALHQVTRSRSLTFGHVPHPTPTGTISSMDLAKKLIGMGANVNARMTRDGMRADGYRTDLNRIGATPYLLAAKGVDHELMRVLLAAGADPMLTNDHGMRPLAVAAGVALHATGEDTGTNEDALEAVKIAYEVDHDVNYADKRGHTALMGASRRGALDVVKFLVERGAQLDAVIKRENFVGQCYGTKGLSWTALTIALGYGKDGQPLFLGSERFLDVGAYLYQEMKKRGMAFENEHEPSLAQVRAMVGEVTTSASR